MWSKRKSNWNVHDTPLWRQLQQQTPYWLQARRLKSITKNNYAMTNNIIAKKTPIKNTFDRERKLRCVVFSWHTQLRAQLMYRSVLSRVDVWDNRKWRSYKHDTGKLNEAHMSEPHLLIGRGRHLAKEKDITRGYIYVNVTWHCTMRQTISIITIKACHYDPTISKACLYESLTNVRIPGVREKVSCPSVAHSQTHAQARQVFTC